MKQICAVFWNSSERRMRAFWRIITHMTSLIIIATVLLLGSMLLTLTGVSVMVGGIEGTGIAVSVIATILSMWFAARLIDRRPFADFGLHVGRDWWLNLGFGLALGALLMCGIFVVELAAGWLTITDTLTTPRPDEPFALAILSPLLFFIGVGVYEELLSRGYWLRNIAEGLRLGPLGAHTALLLAWLISSTLFGMAHAGNPNSTLVSTINLVVAGVFLGLGYVLTGELAIPIGLHITWNFFQGNVFGFPVSGLTTAPPSFIAIEQGGPALWSGGEFGPEAGLIGLLANGVGCLLIVGWVWLRRRREALGLHLTHYAPPVPDA